MKLELSPTEKIVVTFADSDGEITVSFNEDSITIHTDLPDTTFKRSGIIYNEVFGGTDNKKVAIPE